jgi:endonuclease/exonuclease/phosphatase family metal-dependent hydrolase
MPTLHHSKISIATWNAQALFGAFSVNQDRTRRKIALLQRLVYNVDIICIQETHGGFGDGSALDRVLTSHSSVVSESIDTIGGGCLILISKALRRQYWVSPHSVLLDGRVHMVSLIADPHKKLHIVNVHIPPAFPDGRVCTLLRQLRDILAGLVGPVFLLGDWNFVEKGDFRLHLSTGKATVENSAKIREFEHLFVDYVELHQDNFTRAGKKNGLIETLSRIDRIYTNIPTGVLLDYDISAAALGSSAAAFDISDHLPVVVTIADKVRPSGPCAIPAWIAAHPFFPEEVHMLLVLDPLPLDAVEGLSLAVSCCSPSRSSPHPCRCCSLCRRTAVRGHIGLQGCSFGLSPTPPCCRRVVPRPLQALLPQRRHSAWSIGRASMSSSPTSHADP